MTKSRFIVLVLMVLAAACLRLVAHPWNVTPVAAMALFGGATFSDKRWAFVLPLSALFLSDLVLGFYSSMIFVYGAFFLTSLVGMGLFNKRQPMNIVRASLVSSILFFVVTNFGVWLLDGLYSKSFSGFVQCYAMAIPFFRNSVLGDLFFNAVMFGGFSLIERWVPERSMSPASV